MESTTKMLVYGIIPGVWRQGMDDGIVRRLSGKHASYLDTIYVNEMKINFQDSKEICGMS